MRARGRLGEAIRALLEAVDLDAHVLKVFTVDAMRLRLLFPDERTSLKRQENGKGRRTRARTRRRRQQPKTTKTNERSER